MQLFDFLSLSAFLVDLAPVGLGTGLIHPGRLDIGDLTQSPLFIHNVVFFFTHKRMSTNPPQPLDLYYYHSYRRFLVVTLQDFLRD